MGKTKPKLSLGIDAIMPLITEISELRDLLRIAYYKQTDYMSQYAKEQYHERVEKALAK